MYSHLYQVIEIPNVTFYICYTYTAHTHICWLVVQYMLYRWLGVLLDLIFSTGQHH